MDYLLDTAMFILAVRESPAYRAIDLALNLFQGGFQPAASIITRGEVMAFARKRNWGATKLASLESLLSRVTILPIDEESLADRYALLEAENEKKGLNIGQNDLWIAATAIEYGMTLLTTDADFDRCPAPLAYIRYDIKSGAELSRRPLKDQPSA